MSLLCLSHEFQPRKIRAADISRRFNHREVGEEATSRAKRDHRARARNFMTLLRRLFMCPSECRDVSRTPHRRGGEATMYDVGLHRDGPGGVANGDASLHRVYRSKYRLERRSNERVSFVPFVEPFRTARAIVI